MANVILPITASDATLCGGRRELKKLLRASAFQLAFCASAVSSSLLSIPSSARFYARDLE